MIVCPDCGFENIDGADLCETCQQPLDPLNVPTPTSDIEKSIFHDRIRSLARHGPMCVESRTRVAEVLERMVERAVGCVIVLEAGETVGIFSERDALLRLNTNAAAFAGRPISEFMTPNPEGLDMDDKIAFALHRMDAGNYRHIPIYSQGHLCSVISVRDILRYITENAIDPG